MARPSKYTQERGIEVTNNARERVFYSPGLVGEMLDMVANGNPLSRVCEQPRMPSRKTFFAWVERYPEILPKYNLAIALRADLYADETISISDEVEVAAIHNGEEVRLSVDAAAVARNRLRVDARKWYASKLAPKKYGDRIAQEVTGADGGPVQHAHTVGFDAAAADLLAKIRQVGK